MTIDEQIENWEPMIYYVIRMLHVHPNEVDDCAQAARIALWKALLDGRTLSKTYCYVRIRGAVLNYRASRKRALEHEVTKTVLPEVACSDMSVVEFFDWASSVLPPRHYTLLCHLLDGREEELGYSPSRLRAYKAELRKKLIEEERR
ncbi:sigma-70 family RNA polymerase sigma factor [Exiguobacterium sp. SH0S1]|uniref:sigma factor n=1 Tax=Exiguobacterium sp. SH0S1 TaxID=2510949 RepID=UPI00103A03F5|nr:sigma factor [Exiguobacterium sp. SH0S1]TCI77802.1 sigma-70 family RNA polymerase sigma factor [Exiguobacterium sp. SH0S1]